MYECSNELCGAPTDDHYCASCVEVMAAEELLLDDDDCDLDACYVCGGLKGECH